MLNAFFAMEHNHYLIDNAEKTLNCFIDPPRSNIWFEDEAGNRFVPQGNIKIHSYEVVEIIKGRDDE